ncbi:MAG: DoxX family protein [Ferruginibacter sp.]
MKKINILYWVFTGLFSLMMVGAAIPDVLSSGIAVKGMHDGLGYPLYIIPFVGIAKLLGITGILIPGYPRLKEWAYAGLAFDLIGATYSIIVNGGKVAEWGFMAIPLLLGALSYIYYHKKIQQTSIVI